jgi:ferredoxin-NADP reductase
MSKDITEYLERLDIAKFDTIVPNRRRIIEVAKAELPVSEYNANRVAEALHPVVQRLVVSEIQEHGKNAKSYVMKAAPGTETKALAYFRAGQYLSIKLRIGESVLSRPYSIRSAPTEALRGSYTITIKRMDDGFASNFILDSWQVGTAIEASAPLGEFVYEPIRDASHIIGLAGGSGITPFLSMARAIADGPENASLTLLYGSRKHDDILLRNELDVIAGSCSKVKVVHILSDDPGAKGYEHGFITADVIRKYAPSDDFSIFICGPPVMYEFLEKEIASLGLPKRRVRYELFGDCKNPEKGREYPRDAAGKTFKLRVDIHGHKVIVPARSGESLLVAMERAGIAVPSLCRSGVCGFWRSRLVSGNFYIPGDRDYRRMADVEYGYIHPCCTFATSDIHIRVSGDEGEIKRKTLKQRKKAIGLIMTLIMSTIMGVVATILARRGMPPQALAMAAPLPVMMITHVLLSLSVGFLAWLLIPAAKVGGALVAKANARPGSFKATALNCLPVSFSNSTIISIIVCFINVSKSHAKIPPAFAPPLGAMWFSSWIKMYP